MASHTNAYIGSWLRDGGWKKVSPDELGESNWTYLFKQAHREGIQAREAIIEFKKPPRFEPPMMVLGCPFCLCGLELRLYCDEFRQCGRCDAFICVSLDISKQVYVPYAIAGLPKGYFAFAGLPFWESQHWYLKEILQIADRWKSPLTFDRFKELIIDAENKLEKELNSLEKTGR